MTCPAAAYTYLFAWNAPYLLMTMHVPDFGHSRILRLLALAPSKSKKMSVKATGSVRVYDSLFRRTRLPIRTIPRTDPSTGTSTLLGIFSSSFPSFLFFVPFRIEIAINRNFTSDLLASNWRRRPQKAAQHNSNITPTTSSKWQIWIKSKLYSEQHLQQFIWYVIHHVFLMCSSSIHHPSAQCNAKQWLIACFLPPVPSIPLFF